MRSGTSRVLLWGALFVALTAAGVLFAFSRAPVRAGDLYEVLASQPASVLGAIAASCVAIYVTDILRYRSLGRAVGTHVDWKAGLDSSVANFLFSWVFPGSTFGAPATIYMLGRRNVLWRIWPTTQLALATILLQLLIGVPLGIVSAARRGRWIDRASYGLTLLAQSAPTFFVGTLLLYVFAYRFGWFPIAGYGQPGIDRLHHLVLPAATLSTVSVAFYARVVRSELLDVLGEDYIRTARAKGLSERAILGRHALRNAAGPLVTLVGLDLGILLGGAVVTEYIFAWPGLGREVLQAVLDLDLPLITGVVLVSALAIALVNLLVDIIHVWLDPRLRD